MATYGSPHSPSLRKMEGNNKHDTRRRPRMSPAYIVGNPFALATISISILAWLIAFISSIIGATKTNTYSNFSWWTLVYFFFCIIGISVAFALDAVETYRVAIVGYIAAGLVLANSSVNGLVYSPNGAEQAAAAGFILLSIVAIVWIFYFGSEPNAGFRAFVDSFALHKARPSPRDSGHMSSHYMSQQPSPYPPNHTSQMYSNPAQLNGFEATSGLPTAATADSGAVHSRFGASSVVGQSQHSNQGPMSVGQAEPRDGERQLPVEYSFKAKAIYSYEANPDDVNEISFAKHEILDVSDVSGRWWQARKQTGETGIAPSNYLILL